MISWKDKNLVQILSSVQKNKNDSNLTKSNLHNAPPIKHYRKEIQNNNNNNNNFVKSSSFLAKNHQNLLYP